MNGLDTAALREEAIHAWHGCNHAEKDANILALCDEVDRLRREVDLWQPQVESSWARFDHEATTVSRQNMELTRLTETLDRVRSYASLHAVAARAVAHSDEERRWLDVLAIIERAATEAGS